MINRWFYIDDHMHIVLVGPMSMAKARRYEEEEARFLYTPSGLDMLHEQIDELLRRPENAKQLRRD